MHKSIEQFFTISCVLLSFILTTTMYTVCITQNVKQEESLCEIDELQIIFELPIIYFCSSNTHEQCLRPETNLSTCPFNRQNINRQKINS